MQINLQHSRAATDNLIQITEVESTDEICIQQPYTIPNKVVGIPDKFRTYTNARTRRRRTAIVVTNNHIGTSLLKQLSYADAVFAEITLDGLKLILASMYFNIGRQVEFDLSKIEAPVLFIHQLMHQ